MALEISKSDTAKLTIQGTSIELDSIYARVELSAAANGVDMQMGMYYYENATAFIEGSGVVKVKEMKSLYNAKADTEGGQTQTILLASEKVKESLEAEGYTVTIIEL